MSPATLRSALVFPDKTLHYIFVDVLHFDPASPAYSCIFDNDIETLADFLSIQHGDFDQLTFSTTLPTDPTKTVQRVLSLGIKQKLRLFIQYAKSLINDPEEPLTDLDDWLTVSSDDFDVYRMSSRTVLPGASTSLHQQRNPALRPTRAADSLVATFKKGIKRDASAYPLLKDDRAFGTFHSTTLAIARAHDIEDVFNPNYTPDTDEEIALFIEKQKFVYAVLVTTLQTDQGRTFVREQSHDSNAQQVYTKLLRHHRDSPTAKLAIGALQKTLVTLTLDENAWKGTVTGFLLHWREQMRKLHELLPLRDHYSDGFRKTLLEQAVSTISELRAVTSVETNGIAIGHDPLTYSQYAALLGAAATTLDEARLGKDRRPVPELSGFSTRRTLCRPGSGTLRDSLHQNCYSRNYSRCRRHQR